MFIYFICYEFLIFLNEFKINWFSCYKDLQCQVFKGIFLNVTPHEGVPYKNVPQKSLSSKRSNLKVLELEIK